MSSYSSVANDKVAKSYPVRQVSFGNLDTDHRALLHEDRDIYRIQDGNISCKRDL